MESQVGTDPPVDNRLSNRKNLSCGVLLVAVHSRDLMECRASGSTSYQCVTGSPRVSKAILIVFQIVPLYLSTWPLHAGLYGVVRLVATPRLMRN